MSGYSWPYSPRPAPPPKPPEWPIDAPATEQHLHQAYANYRIETAELEHLLAGADDLTEDEQKRLDKAVVLIKVGAKLIKKVLRGRGWRRLKPAELTIHREFHHDR